MAASDPAAWSLPLHRQPVVIANGLAPPRGCWALHACASATALRLRDARLEVPPGSIVLVPSDAHPHDAPAADACTHLRLPPRGPLTPVPVLTRLGERYRDVQDRIAATAREAASDPVRASVRAWDILWQLARLAGATMSAPPADAGMERALAMIDQRLDRDLSVAVLAADLAMPHNRLTRLFRARIGTTVVGYIRRRRVETAIRLLADGLAIPLVSRRVGLRDPAALAATMRELTGRSPAHFQR